LDEITDKEKIVDHFRELLTYVSDLGEHINQIYKYLEKIELNIIEAKDEIDVKLKENRDELGNVKNTMVTKSELEEVIKKFNQTFQEFKPPKALDQVNLPKLTPSSVEERSEN